MFSSSLGGDRSSNCLENHIRSCHYQNALQHQQIYFNNALLNHKNHNVLLSPASTYPEHHGNKHVLCCETSLGRRYPRSKIIWRLWIMRTHTLHYNIFPCDETRIISFLKALCWDQILLTELR